jgi:hypothetical protein
VLYRSIAEVFCILMIAAEGYEELTRTCRAHLGSLQVLEALRRDYKQMETRTVLLEKEVALLYFTCFNPFLNLFRDFLHSA